MGRYTATFTNSAFAVQTKDVEIEMLTPEYADATYTWADDNSSVTAEKKCLNGGADITETVNTTSQITKPATCKVMGETTYYAVFTNGAFAKQEKTVANIEKLAHTPAQAVVENRVEPTYDADGSYDSVVYCSECGEELSRETIVIPKLEKTEVIINSVDINGNQVSATVYKETFTDADYTLPKDEYYDGYDFEGWNINGTTYNTADSAKNAIYDLVTSGTEVTVTMIYEKKSEKFSVTVNGGKLADGTTSGEYQVSTVMKVTANKAASGKKFSHWTTNGVIVSYNETYSFYIYAFDSCVNIIQRDLVQGFRKVCAAAALTGIHDARTSELCKHISYDNSIHARASRKEVARHPHLFTEYINAGDDMDCYCKFTGYLHK